MYFPNQPAYFVKTPYHEREIETGGRRRREQRGENVEGDRRMVRFGGHGCRQTAAICCCGVAIRIALCLFGLQPTLERVMELVVSSASWERAREGLFLGTLGLSHYAGGVFSGSPLMLAAAWLCSLVPAGVQTLAATVLFSVLDVASGLLLRAICQRAVAVESGHWEAQLEGWMDEESKPPGLKNSSVCSSTPQPDSADSAEATVDTPDTYRKPTSNTASSGNSPGGSGPGGVAWNLPDVVLAVYLFNPVLAGQCVALSGDVLGRVFPLAALAAAGSRRPGTTAAALAAATCLWRFYAAPLILPAALMLGSSSLGDGDGSPVVCGDSGGCGSGNGLRGTRGEGGQREHDSAEGEHSGGNNGEREAATSLVEVGAAEETSFDPRYFKLDTKAFLRLCTGFVVWCAVVLGVCWLGTSRSWAFLNAAVSGQLLCEDLTPNAGLYWYFFAELFPRFRGFFRVLFLSQPYVYILPATIRLGMFPEALASLLLAIFGLFHPYPTLADPMLAGCLFLCHPRTSARMRLVIPVGLIALIPALLLPTMRHVWLQAGTGNANFYYFQTVILNVLLCVFVLQFAAALVKRRKALRDAFERRRKSVALGGRDGEVGESVEGRS